MTEYEIKPKRNFSFGFAELWAYRELFYFFVWRDIKVKYKQTYLGVAWAILQPFTMMLIFTFIGYIMKIPSEGLPYPVYFYSGMMLWTIFASGLSQSGDSMITNSSIIKKIYFPRLIIPMSAVLVSVFDFLMTFSLYIGLLIYFHIAPNISIVLYLPAALCITIISCFGLGCFLSALNVKYRDFRYVLPFLIQSMFFLSGVFVPMKIASHKWVEYVLAINPMNGAIQLFRSCITNAEVDFSLVGISAASAVLLLLIGLSYFRKTESYFADLA